MRKRLFKKTVALSLTVCCVAPTLTGCNSFTAEDVTAYPLTSMVTEHEARDYYAKSLDYDSIVSKNIKVHDVTYETKEVPEKKAAELKSMVTSIEKILSGQEYTSNEVGSELISEDTYNYVKGLLDSISLDKGKVDKVTGALGYYFVDVTYSVGDQAAGTFTELADYLGLNGVWKIKVDGTYEVNEGYIASVAKLLNEYFRENGLNYTATASSNLNSNVLQPGMTTLQPSLTNTNGYLDITNKDINNINKEEIKLDDKSFVADDRKVQLDINLINTVAGSSLSQASFLPDLDIVYVKPKSSGFISGYGIYPEGVNGLRNFGFKRSDMNGTLTMRYVFKDSTDGSGKILGNNIYCTKYELQNGFNVSSEEIIVPEFLNTELCKVIERADRAKSNFDLPAMLNSEIYEDKGHGVLLAYKNNSSYNLRNMSKIRSVLARDNKTNTYLLSVDTTVIEGPRSVEYYGTYLDKYYVVVQQQGDKFLISDSVRISREVTREPSIEPDNATTKRVVALNLSGEIDKDSKSEITQLMSNLYTAGTNRLLKGPGTIKVNGEKVTIEKGMYDCFNSDVSMLSSSDNEYMNSKLRGVLIKYGVNTAAIHNGVVLEWIGGNENQAEFTTEELVTYSGLNKGHYMKVYYLVSKMKDNWVIDERTIIDEYEVVDKDLNTVKERINK